MDPEVQKYPQHRRQLPHSRTTRSPNQAKKVENWQPIGAFDVGLGVMDHLPGVKHHLLAIKQLRNSTLEKRAGIFRPSLRLT
jgi:hypothetical protein